MTKIKKIKVLRKKVKTLKIKIKKSKKIIIGLQDIIIKLDKKVRSIEKHLSIGKLRITINEYLNKIPGKASSYSADLYFIFDEVRINELGIKFSSPWIYAHMNVVNNPLILYMQGYIIAKLLNAKYEDDVYIVHNRAGDMKCL